MLESVIFYIFAGLLVFAAFMVITVRNPVHAALFLVLSFFCSAAIWLLLEAEFLAIVLVLVYVGAVMVLFLFVVMMLDINISVLREGFASYVPMAAVVAFLMAGGIIAVVAHGYFAGSPSPAPRPADYNNTADLGAVLYTDYVYAFEIAAVVLLVAIIAAIALTMRPRRQTKAQRPELQIQAKREGRVKLVDIGSEGVE